MFRKAVCLWLAALAVLLLSPAGLADSFHIAPYLQNVTKDGVTILLETQDESRGVVEYGLEGKLDKQAEEATPAKIHRVRVTGLDAETSYTYRVKAGSKEHASTFKTAPATRRPITFVAMGD